MSDATSATPTAASEPPAELREPPEPTAQDGERHGFRLPSEPSSPDHPQPGGADPPDHHRM